MAAQTIKAGEAFLELSIRDSKFARSLDRAIARLRALGASLKNIGSLGISGGGIAGLQRALTLIAGSAALTWPVKLAADLEVAEAQFTALTGSAQKAREVLLDLQQFTSQTSLSFDQLIIAARNMLQFGVSVENLMPTLRALSAISIGNADQLDRLTVAFGQVQAKGRLMAEEVRQMVNAGFNPLQEISRTTGTSMRQLIKDMEAGRISAAQVAEAFQSAVGPSGRFHGILALIEATAIGQFRKLAAGIKIAVIPLGRELLPSIAGVLRYVNNLIPSLQTLIRDNASWAKVIAATVLGLSGMLATLFGLGVAFQLVAFSAGGLAAAIGVLTSPIVLVGAAIAGLGTLFVRFTELGAAAFGFIAEKLGLLGEIARETFEGIADALAAGSLPAAANVLWAGINLAWLEGTAEIKRLWIDFKFFFLQNTTEFLFGALDLWHIFAASLKGIWSALVTESRTIGERIGHYLTRSDDPELAAEQDAAHQAALDNIQREGEAERAENDENLRAALEANEKARRAAEEAREAQLRGDIEAAKKAQEEALRAFQAAREAAAKARPPGGGFQGGGLPGLDGIEEAAAASGIGSRSTFSGKLAPQIFGAGADTIGKQLVNQGKKQIQLLDGIKDNTFQKRRGLFVGNN